MALPAPAGCTPGRWQALMEGARSNPFLREALDRAEDASLSALEGDVSPRHLRVAGSLRGLGTNARYERTEGSVENSRSCPATLLRHSCSRLKHWYQPVGI